MAKIDKNIEKIYRDFLRKLLKNPGKWDTSTQYYMSPFINDENNLRFQTESYIMSSSRCDHVDIYKDGQRIHRLEINWLDFKTQNLLENMFKYWDKKRRDDEIEKTNSLLTKSLGSKYDRFIKISKIKNNM